MAIDFVSFFFIALLLVLASGSAFLVFLLAKKYSSLRQHRPASAKKRRLSSGTLRQIPPGRKGSRQSQLEKERRLGPKQEKSRVPELYSQLEPKRRSHLGTKQKDLLGRRSCQKHAAIVQRPCKRDLTRAIDIFRDAMRRFIVHGFQEAGFQDVVDAIMFALNDQQREDFARVRRRYRDLESALDVGFFFPLVSCYWNDVFSHRFGGDKMVLRRLRKIAEARNIVSHPPHRKDLDKDYTRRCIAEIEKVLEVVGTTGGGSWQECSTSNKRPNKDALTRGIDIFLDTMRPHLVSCIRAGTELSSAENAIRNSSRLTSQQKCNFVQHLESCNDVESALGISFLSPLMQEYRKEFFSSHSEKEREVSSMVLNITNARNLASHPPFRRDLGKEFTKLHLCHISHVLGWLKAREEQDAVDSILKNLERPTRNLSGTPPKGKFFLGTWATLNMGVRAGMQGAIIESNHVRKGDAALIREEDGRKTWVTVVEVLRRTQENQGSICRVTTRRTKK